MINEELYSFTNIIPFSSFTASTGGLDEPQALSKGLAVGEENTLRGQKESARMLKTKYF